MDKSIPFSPSRLDTSIFLEKNLKTLIKNRQEILDIGFGKLYFYQLLCQIGAHGTYLGIDLSPLKLTTKASNLNSLIQKVDFLKFKSKKKFSIVACLWVLEHIRQDNQALKKVASLVAHDGIFILAVPSVWSWPFEFGRHGFHYYSKRHILDFVEKFGFKVVKFYESSGFLGFIFMILYNWPRFLILVPSFIVYRIVISLKLSQKSWSKFSASIIRRTIYRYHRSEKGIILHNYIVKKIVDLDNNLKVFPGSYILILKKQ